MSEKKVLQVGYSVRSLSQLLGARSLCILFMHVFSHFKATVLLTPCSTMYSRLEKKMNAHLSGLQYFKYSLSCSALDATAIQHIQMCWIAWPHWGIAFPPLCHFRTQYKKSNLNTCYLPSKNSTYTIVRLDQACLCITSDISFSIFLLCLLLKLAGAINGLIVLLGSDF